MAAEGLQLGAYNEMWVYPKDHIRVLLANKVAKICRKNFKKEGFNAEEINKLPSEKLHEVLKYLHVLGIRSKTFVTEEHLRKASELLCIGCYCIGTDQVDHEAAGKIGIPVFNSPFGNTRSVAELIISQIIQLARKSADRNRECHEGKWGKTHIGCHEIRGKTVGIVGYGHVGSQVSILAEGMGMKVMYYDIIPKLALGNAIPVHSLEELLPQVDFLTLHVPFTEKTENMIKSKQISQMRKGTYLLNAARGKCVVLEDVAEAIKSGQLGGAYFDVYPTEPIDADCCLCGLPNVILSPHIGGSTEEAQVNIGVDVTAKLARFINEGCTTGAVNFPEVSLPTRQKCHRICNVHQNVPGVLKQINSILSDYNVAAQMLSTKGDIGYMVVDLESEKGLSAEIKARFEKMHSNIRTRVIWKKEYESPGRSPLVTPKINPPSL